MTCGLTLLHGFMPGQLALKSVYNQQFSVHCTQARVQLPKVHLQA
jgi:hypothetical protein